MDLSEQMKIAHLNLNAALRREQQAKQYDTNFMANVQTVNEQAAVLIDYIEIMWEMLTDEQKQEVKARFHARKQ